MSNLKKYLQFLCIITVCLNSTFIISSEYYIPVPDTYAFSSPEAIEGGTSLLKNVSDFMKEAIRNDPRFVVVPLVAAVGGLLYMERTNISTYAQKQCDILEQETKDYLERGINTNTPSFFLGKTMRMYLLRPLFIGIPTYLSYNKFYIAAAFICCIGGRFFGFPVPGGLLAGTSLAAGWLQQGHAVTHQRLDEVQAAIEKSRQENEILHQKAEAKLNEIDAKVTALPGQLTTHKEEITKAIKEVETTTSHKIDQVGDQVRNMDAKVGEMGDALTVKVEGIGKKVDLLNGVPEQILSLLSEVNIVKTQNMVSTERTNALFEKLKETSAQFVATKEAIAHQVQDLVKATVDSNQKIETTQTMHAEQLNTLVTCTAEQGGKLTVLQNLLETIQKEQSKHAETIFAKFDTLVKEAEVNKQELQLLNTFKLSTSSGIAQLTTDLSLLSAAQEKMQASLSNFFSDIEARFAEINDKVEVNQELIKGQIESNQVAMVEKMSKTRDELKADNKKLKQKIKKMNAQQFETTTALLRLESTVQQLGAKIVEQNSETQGLIVQGFTDSASFVSLRPDVPQQEQNVLDQILPLKKYTPPFRRFPRGGNTMGVETDNSQSKSGILVRQNSYSSAKRLSQALNITSSDDKQINLFQ
jgi:hypothetical protein